MQNNNELQEFINILNNTFESQNLNKKNLSILS